MLKGFLLLAYYYHKSIQPCWGYWWKVCSINSKSQSYGQCL